jgi:hypothetical protein
MSDEQPVTFTVTLLANERLPLADLRARADEVGLPYTVNEDETGIVLDAADEVTAEFWRERGVMWGQPEEDEANAEADADNEANTVLPGDSLA